LVITNNLARVHRRIRKIYYWQQNSIPYLSGDAFADSADFQAFPPKFRVNQNSKSSLSEAKVIFCPSHFARQFVEENIKQISARVLIFGNSDQEFDELDFRLPSSVKHVFAQNLLTKNSKIISGIPIGLENLRLGNNGRPKLIRTVNSSDTTRVLVGPFSMTHEERKEFQVDGVKVEARIEYLDGRIAPDQYSLLAQQFKFIASPRGNGIDTHRFWETLYRGSIPVVKDSIWRQNFDFLADYIAVTKTWGLKDILDCTGVDTYPTFNPQKIEELWWPYWQSRIRAYL
jgi:hypothetical protein